jgi:uncharacterized protein (DUF486 family)
MSEVKDYLKFIPAISSNVVLNSILLTFIPGVLYVLAAYGHLLVTGMGLGLSIVVSIIFAALEYIVRVPIIKYSSEIAGMSNGIMQLVWVSITMLLSWMSGWIMPVH